MYKILPTMVYSRLTVAGNGVYCGTDSSRIHLPGGMLTVRSGPSMPMVDHSNLVPWSELDSRAFSHRGNAAGSSPMRLGRGIAAIAQIGI
jgi:hypothetical protein